MTISVILKHSGRPLKDNAHFLFEQSVTGNNQLGRIYQKHQPAPLLSSMVEGCITSGKGITRGGAKYNSSGVSIIGLTDVLDSLTAIKKPVPLHPPSS